MSAAPRRAASYPAAEEPGNRENGTSHGASRMRDRTRESARVNGSVGAASGPSADTRVPGGPKPRLYEAPFAHVWDELLRYVNRRRLWRLAHRDEELGLISVRCVVPIVRFVDDLTVWVALDANGLTRVNALSRARRRDFDLGMNRRRIARMLRMLDRRLGPTARLSESTAGSGRDTPSEAAPGAS